MLISKPACSKVALVLEIKGVSVKSNATVSVPGMQSFANPPVFIF